MDATYIACLVVAALIITIAVFYALSNMNKRSSNCNKLKKSTPLQNISANDTRYESPLRDFQVKSSYNSCASGGFKNDWVDLCALTHAIQEGCRFLDFEIYDLDGAPVVGVSDTPAFTLKHSYNYLPLDAVLKTIEDQAFGGGVNGMDPLFLNFRIKSDHVEICDAVATAIALQPTLASRLLGPEYSYSFEGQNFGLVPLNELIQKVVIMASENPRISESKLAEYVNVSPSPSLRVLNFNALASQDLTEITDYALQKLLVVTPSSADNYTSVSTATLGTQFSAMNLQTNDTNLAAYTAEFVSNGNRAFFLKANRYVQTNLPDAAPLPEDTTFGTTQYTNKFFNYSL